MKQDWQIYCGHYPIAAGRGLAISGQVGHRLCWRTELDKVMQTRLRSGFSIYISVGNGEWVLYRLQAIVPATSSVYDVSFEPIKSHTPDRLRDRLALG